MSNDRLGNAIAIGTAYAVAGIARKDAAGDVVLDVGGVPVHARASDLVPYGSGRAFDLSALAGLTAKGDLITRSATVPVRKGVGTDHFILVPDASQADGLRWASPFSAKLQPIDYVFTGKSPASVTELNFDFGAINTWTEQWVVVNRTMKIPASGAGTLLIYTDGVTDGDATLVLYSNNTPVASYDLSIVTGQTYFAFDWDAGAGTTLTRGSDGLSLRLEDFNLVNIYATAHLTFEAA